MSMYQCPISFGFYERPDLTPSLSALLIEEWRNRKAGIVPPWGSGSALYHQAMSYIGNLVSEREGEQVKALPKAK